jgi:hypothetical protein
VRASIRASHLRSIDLEPQRTVKAGHVVFARHIDAMTCRYDWRINQDYTSAVIHLRPFHSFVFTWRLIHRATASISRLATSSICGFLTLRLPSNHNFLVLAVLVHSTTSPTTSQLQLRARHLERFHNYYNINNKFNIHTTLFDLSHQGHIRSGSLSSIPPTATTVHPMAHFLDLPPEIRLFIYNALLVDPIRKGSRLVCTVDASGESSWSRVVWHMSTDNMRPAQDPPKLIESSISHTDYSDLLSLARTNKLLYLEATPTMYSHAQLEYTSGDTSSAHADQTLFHKYLEKLSPTTSTLYHDLTINYGHRNLSAKDVKALVDLINLKLPNLLSTKIQVVTSEDGSRRWASRLDFVKDFLQTIVAARPVAGLNAPLSLSIKPRARLYFGLGPCRYTQYFHHLRRCNWSNLTKVTHTLLGIRYWRREAQDYHGNACQRGDYLVLTSYLRSALAGAAEIDAVEVLDGMEDELAIHQKVLSWVKKHETLRIREV